MDATREEVGVATTVGDEDSRAGRHGSAGLFLFKKEADAAEETPEDLAALEAERAANKKLADALADEEQRRRVEEDKDREDETAVVRQINVELSISAEEQERERRVHELEIAKVQEEMARRRSQAEAIEAAEQERTRRISEAEEVQVQDLKERVFAQELAVQAMEKERVRRLSLPEHRERAPSAVGATGEGPPGLERFYSCKSVEGEEEEDAALSEIPVVHASASKVPVDENSEWRCFIASEDAQEEKNQLHALRLSLEEELKVERHAKYAELVGDVRLLRFLRGHKMNVSVAATKYREMLAMRQKLNLDDIRDDIVSNNMEPDEFPHFQKIIPHLPFLDTYDIFSAADGHVFYFEMTGYADFHKLLTEVTEDEWQTFFLYSMEYRALKLDQLSRQNERLVQTIQVRDLSGFSIARFNPKLLGRLKPLVSIATKCYPESMHKMLVLHAPWIFDKVWTGVKSMLQETQLRKVHMEGNSLERLLDLAGSRDKLPKLLGGRSTTHAIPQTGFLGRNSFLLLCEDGATEADIKAGGTLQLPFRMSANDTLCWEYVVKERDIAFAVKFRTQGIGGAEESEKVAPERVSSGAPISSSFTATEDGTVVLSWDNSFSWARGKTIAYKAKVVKSTHDFSSLDISGNDCV
ncbi:Phosphatidylinositol transfer protein SEC14 [Phytophthora cinnamomi]|uniref:Phosphatidylinositol transfer protein SEC14 n=1 Tax=Phytophthora cinnamomi TaxID=4785 RepID=UPI003559A0C6|nr:Phosphatidylinositol transfer protein SEC14 [Phytophthora cinnamomi]